MAPRANWKGFLRLSLVTCPVALFPATSESEKISFNQLNRQTGHRIKFAHDRLAAPWRKRLLSAPGRANFTKACRAHADLIRVTAEVYGAYGDLMKFASYQSRKYGGKTPRNGPRICWNGLGGLGSRFCRRQPTDLSDATAALSSEAERESLPD